MTIQITLNITYTENNKNELEGLVKSLTGLISKLPPEAGAVFTAPATPVRKNKYNNMSLKEWRAHFDKKLK